MILTTAILSCILQAAQANNINPDIIASVILTEGGYTGAVSKNKNKSVDLGVMQINDKAWLPLVSSKLFDGNKFMAYHRLKNDDCFNIFVGSWILAEAIKNSGGNLWEGVGLYHSANPRLKYIYKKKVINNYSNLRHKGQLRIDWPFGE